MHVEAFRMERSRENIESSHDAKIVKWSNDNKYMYVYVVYIIAGMLILDLHN